MVAAGISRSLLSYATIASPPSTLIRIVLSYLVSKIKQDSRKHHPAPTKTFVFLLNAINFEYTNDFQRGSFFKHQYRFTFELMQTMLSWSELFNISDFRMPTRQLQKDWGCFIPFQLVLENGALSGSWHSQSGMLNNSGHDWPALIDSRFNHEYTNRPS